MGLFQIFALDPHETELMSNEEALKAFLKHKLDRNEIQCENGLFFKNLP